jgi:hypothetical protein
MSMSKGNAKHMSAESEKSFEEKLEGQDFGDIDDWGAHLGSEILDMERKVEKSIKSTKPNLAVINLLEKRIDVYNAALSFIDKNPKAAALVGDGKGVKAVVAYIISKAQEKEAEAELETYITQVQKHLPGHKLNAVVKANVVVRGQEAAAAASSSAP